MVTLPLIFFIYWEQVETFQNSLLPLSNCLNLEFRNFFFGISNGNFITKYPYNRLVFFFGSKGITTIGDDSDTIEFKRGMWLLIPASKEAKHSHSASRHLSIHFSFSMLRGVEILASKDNFFYGNNVELTQIAETIVESSAPLRFISGVQLLCREILFEVLKDDIGDMEQFYSGFIKYSKLTEYLHQNCNFNITVSDMAKIMNMGEQSFAKKFVADTGTTPKKFSGDILASHAAKLLIGTELSVKEIAEEMGFCNEFYFSRFFKRHFCFSPTGFRQNIRQHKSLSTDSLGHR